jgi:hypothetical protein
MKNCIYLAAFEVRHNRIRERGFQAIFQRVRVLPLSHLHLSGGNQMSISNFRELLKLPSPIDPNSSIEAKVIIESQIYEKVGVLCLKRLDLGGMNLGDEGATVLANSFSIMVSLKSVIFCENAVGQEGANALWQSLPNASNLEYLNLGSNLISPEYVEKFKVRIKTRAETGLPQVCVNLDGQYILISDEEAKVIARKIPSLEDGTEMDFFSERKKFTIYGKGLVELANGMREIFKLQPLKISF